MKRISIIAAFLVGVNAIISQVILIRELLVNFSGNELSVGIILASWLIGGALGSLMRIGGPKAEEAIANLLRSGSPATQEGILSALRNAPSEANASFLEKLLQDEDYEELWPEIRVSIDSIRKRLKRIEEAEKHGKESQD